MFTKILKVVKKIVLGLFLFILVSGLGILIWASDKYTVPIMMYHSIDYQQHHLEESANVVPPEYFRQHLDWLKEYKYNVIGMPEFVEGLYAGRKFPGNTAVITFDDGYVDNYVYAFPILQEYGYTATFFISSDLIGKESFMTWEQVKEMQKAGMTIASHGRTHPYLPGISPERQYDEVTNSKKIIEEQLGTPVEYFAYPIGGFSDEIKEMVKQAGYKAAVTTNRGHVKYHKDLYEMKRIRFGKYKPRLHILKAKLSGYYNLFRKTKNSH